MIPPADKIVICFAHVAYRLHERFAALDSGISSFAVRDLETLETRVAEADVLVISGLWQNQLLDRDEKAPLHPVDRRRHRPIPARRADKAQHPARERPRRQCARGR